MTEFYSGITSHSIDRAKTRLNKNQKNAVSYISKAIARGKRAEEFTSMERKYLESKCENGCEIIVYDGNCFIIAEDVCCLTLYRLPNWFGKKKHFDGKMKIRNPKRYYRSDDWSGERNMSFSDASA